MSAERTLKKALHSVNRALARLDARSLRQLIREKEDELAYLRALLAEAEGKAR